MGIIITGATGFIGQNIIPFFKKENIDILLVGRDEEKLRKKFPNEKIATYNNLLEKLEKFNGFNILLHLAILNNNKKANPKQFEKANIDLLLDIIEKSKKSKIKKIIYTSSLQINDKKNNSPYTQSKRDALKIISNIKEINIINLNLPIVYGKNYCGKLAFLNKFPSFLSSIIFSVLSALKPTTNIEKIANCIINISKEINSNKLLSRSMKVTNITLTDQQRGNIFYAFSKRFIDLTFAIFIVIFVSWFLFIIFILIKFTSKGEAIFSQKRIGKDGKIFTLFKFRTMQKGTINAATHEISRDKITKIGHFLRKTKIDELPQIINIFKNEISLVGPRPCLPSQKKLIKERQNLSVLRIKGGITGLAQIQGIDMSDAKKLAKVDEEYLNLRSIILDLKIILATIIGKGQGDRTN